MNFEYSHLLPAGFPAQSRVWIYQSSRPFGMMEALQIESRLEQFIAQWKSHADPIRGYANLLFGQFIVLIADESSIRVSGCSTDASVRVIRQIETEFNVQLFDRQHLAFIVKDQVERIPLSQFNYAIENGFISSETSYFNNTVQTLEELNHHWIIPVKESWLAKRLQPAS